MIYCGILQKNIKKKSKAHCLESKVTAFTRKMYKLFYDIFLYVPLWKRNTILKTSAYSYKNMIIS